MKAAWYEQFGAPDDVLTVGELEDPKPGPGEGLVRLKASSVNPSDVKKRAGSFPNLLDDGYVIPHSDGAGVIESVGEGVSGDRVGDEVWGGVNVISLPDLSHMQVKTYVNEVDVDKLDTGQVATIKLDALPEPNFTGRIKSIASLGREKEGEKNVKVFDVVLEIEEKDDRLKPGMSATSKVIIETIPPKPEARPDSIQTVATDEVVSEAPPMPLFIPLDTIFEKDGRTLVYLMVDGQAEEREITLGKKNEDFVVVEEGLSPDDRIALRDPTQAADAIGGMEDSASPKVQ